MAAKMRAKMIVQSIVKNGEASETLRFRAVARDDPYPADGSDENNTFAKFSPSADLSLTVANPALMGQFSEGEAYYLDFTPVA